MEDDNTETPAAMEGVDEGVTRSGRARRSTVKKVDYAKAQEFSDEDIFEDSDEREPEPKPSAARKRTYRPRKSSKKRGDSPTPGGPGGIAHVDVDEDEDGEIASRPAYTEKGYDPMLPPIRERFPFLP